MRDITTAEYAYVCQLIQELCGIHLDSQKEYLVQTRLSALISELGSDSYADLVRQAKSDLHVRSKVIDTITTHETMFFRHPPIFQLIQSRLLPRLTARKEPNNKTLQIWSAACSTGQEVYSLAIIASEAEQAYGPRGLNCRIQGTDISHEAIQKAAHAAFTDSELTRGLSESLRTKYFVPQGEIWAPIPQLRKMCSFRQQNLLEPFAEQMYDLVLCCNIAIYFSKENRIKLFSKLIKHIRPGGFLVLGASEVLEEGLSDIQAFEEDGVRYFLKTP